MKTGNFRLNGSIYLYIYICFDLPWLQYKCPINPAGRTGSRLTASQRITTLMGRWSAWAEYVQCHQPRCSQVAMKGRNGFSFSSQHHYITIQYNIIPVHDLHGSVLTDSRWSTFLNNSDKGWFHGFRRASVSTGDCEDSKWWATIIGLDRHQCVHCLWFRIISVCIWPEATWLGPKSELESELQMLQHAVAFDLIWPDESMRRCPKHVQRFMWFFSKVRRRSAVLVPTLPRHALLVGAMPLSSELNTF